MTVEVKGAKIWCGNVSNGHVSAEFSRSLLDMVSTDINSKWNLCNGVLWCRSGVNITQKRNELIRQFLDDTDGDWLLMLDSDMVFPRDIMPRLLHAAQQADAKAIGGLCVVVDEEKGPFPTMYHGGMIGDTVLGAQVEYKPNEITRVTATGAACFMVHREVLEAIKQRNKEDYRWIYENKDNHFIREITQRSLIDVPSERHGWFREHPVITQINENGNVKTREHWVGEDIDFCLRIGRLGYAIYVDTGLEIGHHKEDRIWWPHDIKEGTGFRRPKVAAVIPVKDKLELTQALIQQIREDRCDGIIICDNGSEQETKDWLAEQEDITVLDCPDIGINEMWNRGAQQAIDMFGQKTHIAFLNNDLRLGDGFLDKLSLAIFKDPEYVAVCGNYDGRRSVEEVVQVHDICANRYDGTGGFAGFAFMFRAEWYIGGYRFPDECMWWYGDNDLITSITVANAKSQNIPIRAGIVIGAEVEHLDGGGGTSGDVMWSAYEEQLEKDKAAYSKIHIDQMRQLQEALSGAPVVPAHTCKLEHIEHYVNRISADKLPFIADLEDSVNSFTRQWTDDVPGMVKLHEDVERYEKIIAETRPEVIIECGTWDGGSAKWLRNQDLDVITIDIEDHVLPENRTYTLNGNHITWLVGNSVDAEIVAKVKELVGDRRCMVSLDSDHHSCHVLAEMELYGPLVSPGCYMVVEDGIVRFVPIKEHSTLIKHGPLEAIESYLNLHKDFERDEDIEKLHPVTMHPAGWLKKVS